MKKSTCFWIYILECENGCYYTGYTNNLVRRYRQHVDGTANARYTKIHKPIRIAQCWRLFEPIGTTLKIEYFIKRRDRKIKELLVETPGMLKTLISEKLDLNLNVFTFDPSKVETESLKTDWKILKNGTDPFSRLPPKDF